MTAFLRMLRQTIAVVAVSFLWLAPAAAQNEEDMPPVQQIPLDDALVTRFIQSFHEISTTMAGLDKDYDPEDPEGLIDELDYLGQASESLHALDEKVRAAGFSDYKAWYDTTQSIMIARGWILDPPNMDEMNAAEAEINALTDITDQEREDLLAGIREAMEQAMAMKPADANLDAVRPHMDALEAVFGGSN